MAGKGGSWGSAEVLRLLSLTQQQTMATAEAMAAQGIRDAGREIAALAPDASFSAPRVTVDAPAIRGVVLGLGDRILAKDPNTLPSAHINGNAWQASRILGTEAFAAYNLGRLAVELALVAAGAGPTFAIPTEVRRDWVVGIVVRWDARLDRRTCPVCAALEGTLRPLGMTFDGGPTPPKHTNCRCCAQFWPVAVPRS